MDQRPAPSWWLTEALADEPGERVPALDHDVEADVVIVGGGYTGMWTALAIKEREPDTDVVVLEQDIVGSGPSGRNGGFLNDLWEDVEVLVRLLGEERAAEVAQLSSRSIPAIGAFCEENKVDAWYKAVSHLGVSTAPNQDAAGDSTRELIPRLGGRADRYEKVTPEGVQEVCRSPVFRNGTMFNHVAMVQPARLARGLRRVLLERGVRLYEHSPVTRFQGGPPAIAETPRGRVRAPQAVLAVNAWAAKWKQFHHAILPRASYIVLTAPAPERLEEIGWTGGQSLFDFRVSLHYVSTTPDGRIAFGGASAKAGVGVGMGPRVFYDDASVRKLTEDLWRWFPNFRDVPIERAWGGPIDVSGTHLPFFGTLESGNVHYGLGFTGGGVGPSHMAGQILSGLALGVQDEYSTMPLVGMQPKRYPPEPILSVGAFITNEAIVRTDDAHDHGKRPNPVLNLLAHLPRKLGFNLGA